MMWRNQKIKGLTFVLVISLLAGTFSGSGTVFAENLNGIVMQVNGKYTITATQLTTKCRLETEDSTIKKKVRSYKITSKTKIYRWSEAKEDYNIFEGNKRNQMIKKLNRNNKKIQFRLKNNVVERIWVIE